MGWNGSGSVVGSDGVRTGSNVCAQQQAANQNPTAALFDAQLEDIRDAIENCIAKDGQATVSANIPMNSKKFTGLAAGTGAGDSVRYEQLAVAQITSGTITGITDLAVADGGTGASTAAAARAALGAAASGANTDISSITQDTVDGSDTEALAFCGGGANALTRGAIINLFGNESATNGGSAYIYAGNASTGDVVLFGTHASTKIRFITGGVERFTIDGAGFIYRWPEAVNAAGSTQGDATAITAPCNLVSTGGASRGVVLPTLVANVTIRISNTNATTSIKIYPDGAHTINGTTSMTLNPLASVELIPSSATNWAVF